MKILQRAAILVSLLAFTSGPTIAEVPALPDTGTYFIVNSQSDEALQAGAASIGQSVFAQEFNKGGLQKWAVTRKIDPKTKKPTNRYTVRLGGEIPGLNFQPHPVTDSNAIISMDTSVFVLESGEGGYLVKSVAKNGDALCIYPSPPSYTETRFAPSDGSAKFRWKFIPAN